MSIISSESSAAVANLFTGMSWANALNLFGFAVGYRLFTLYGTCRSCQEKREENYE